MVRRGSLFALVLALVLETLAVLAAPAGAQDWRDTFGTRSAAAAQQLDAGMKLVQQKKPKESLEPLAKALEADPDLQLAYYWKALAHTDLGEIDQSLELYEKLVQAARRTKATNVTIDACINAGLILIEIKQDGPSVWFTRAITLDPDDVHHLRWKAFRNMAIWRHGRKEYLTAAICALAAYSADPRRVDIRMVVDFLGKVDQEEVAQVLDFGGAAAAKLAARSEPTKLEEGPQLEGLDGPVTKLLPDVLGRQVLAFSAGKPKLFVIDSENGNKVTTVATPGPVRAVSLAGPRVFLSVEGAGIVEIELPTGNAKKTWALKTMAPTSLAAMPTKGVAVFPVEQVLHVLDLGTGAVTATEFLSHEVAADPGLEFCYSFVRSERGPRAGHVMINGRPVLIQQSRADWTQSAVFKYAIVNKQLLAAEIRMNAASNGRQLVVSPDGRWIGLAGGGGWRPTQAQGHKAGYGVAMFAAGDFQQIQGFYSSEAYPTGAAVNPITQQIAVVRDKDSSVYHLASAGDAKKLEGPFLGPAAWSPEGKFLYLAHATGVRVFRNEITASEEKAGAEWAKGLAQKVVAEPGALQPAPAEANPIPGYAEFALEETKEAVEKAVALALESGRTDKPREWLVHAPYHANPEVSGPLREMVNLMDREKAGTRLYRLKKVKEKDKEHPGVDFLIGMTQFVLEQWEPAVESLLSAIRRDQGRTNLTLESLRCLGQIQKRLAKPQAAALCYAHVMRLDLANPGWKGEAEEIFKLAKLEGTFEPLAAKASALGKMAAAVVKVALPALVESTDKTRHTAESLYKQCSPSVVMVRTSGGSGSGVCIAAGGIIVTNQHVIRARDGKIAVHTYSTVGDKLVRSEALDAELLFQSEADDLALVRVKDAVKLVPLPLETEAPATGSKVFALGSPGLGGVVLEQTITEGIVSAGSRALGRKSFIQHTAAVNPGNSGGPLVNEFGRVVGIVTLKTELERVGFAIPASQVREIYGTVRKTE